MTGESDEHLRHDQGRDFRIQHANAHADASDGHPVVQIGMDTPQVTPTLLGDALDLVARGGARSVLGLAEDGGEERPRFSRSRDEGAGRGARSFDKPKFDRPRGDRPKFDRPREARDDRGDRPTFRRPREDREPSSRDWKEHPRGEGRGERFGDRGPMTEAQRKVLFGQTAASTARD